MRRIFIAIGLILMLAASAQAERLKNIVHIDGVIDNNLRGVGLVVGLNGTGDGDGYANVALMNMMKRLLQDFNITQDQIESKNVALVFVTATMPAFSKVGTKVDVKVASAGNAESLKGGVLLETHLKAPGDDKTVWALADGTILLAGSEKEVPTCGDVIGGGVVVEEEPTDYIRIQNGMKMISLLLNNPDFNTANGVVDAICSDTQLFKRYSKRNIAKAINPGQIDIIIPSDVDEVNFISKILDVNVDVHTKGRVVINERTKSIIIGEGVTVTPVIIIHNGLTLKVGEIEQSATILEARGSESQTPLQQIQAMLNAVKAKPEDVIAIIMALKAAGALQGEVIVK